MNEEMSALRPVLILPNFGLGDLIQITGAFKMAKKSLPGLQLYCANYGAPNQEILTGNPYVDGLVPIVDPHNIKRGLVYRLAAIIKNYRAMRPFEHIFFAMPLGSFGVITRLPAMIIRPHMYCMPFSQIMDSQCYDYQIELASFLGIEDPRVEMPEVFLSQDDLSAGLALLADLGFENEFVAALVCDAGTWSKHLPVEICLMVARFLHELGCRVLLFKGTNYPFMADEVASRATHPLEVLQVGNLRRSMAVLACCKVTVCPDTGLSHLSAALGLPTIAMFGPTNIRFKPVGPRSCVVDKSPGCRIVGTGSECLRCRHPDYRDDGKHAAACMYWFKEADLVWAIHALGIEKIFPKRVPDLPWAFKDRGRQKGRNCSKTDGEAG